MVRNRLCPTERSGAESTASDGDRFMRGLARWVVVALGGCILLRAGYFLSYAWYQIASPLENGALEAKMAHLAWRVQEGVRLYPEWRDHTHDSNSYGPIYFVLVGLLGRAAGASLHGLMMIGRWVTVAGWLATALLVARAVSPVWGRTAGIFGAVATIGSLPLYGFGIMVRPDTLAEFFGLLGLIIAARTTTRDRVTLAGAGVALFLAVMTKQTAVIFLLATGATLAATGRARLGAGLMLGVIMALSCVVATVTWFVEPNFLPSLLGESQFPWSFKPWRYVFTALFYLAPDLLVVPPVGLVLWTIYRPRPEAWMILTTATLLFTLLASMKLGSDINYALTLRVVEGLAVGTLIGLLLQSSIAPPRLTAACGLTLAAAMIPGVVFAQLKSREARSLAHFHNTAVGIHQLEELKFYLQLAANPRFQILSDSGLFELYQRSRAEFVDPFGFRIQVETGQIQIDEMLKKVDRLEYNYIITSRDLFDPEYSLYIFGLPLSLVERVRARYVPRGLIATDLFLYSRP
jgi:hypothetical protein